MRLEQALRIGRMRFAVVLVESDDGSGGFPRGLGAGDAPEVQDGTAKVFRSEAGRHLQCGHRIGGEIEDHDL